MIAAAALFLAGTALAGPSGPTGPCAFDRTVAHGGWSARVTAGNSGSCGAGEYTVTARPPSGAGRQWRWKRAGRLLDVWLADLARDGRMELIVVSGLPRENADLFLLAPGGPELRPLPPLPIPPGLVASDPHFTHEDESLYCTVALFRPGDRVDRPSGGMRRFRYDLKGNSWFDFTRRLPGAIEKRVPVNPR